MKKPYHGEQFGCFDQGKPINHTEYELSRVYDMLYAAELTNLSSDNIKKIFSILPESLRLEYNYSNWKYNSNWK